MGNDLSHRNSECDSKLPWLISLPCSIFNPAVSNPHTCINSLALRFYNAVWVKMGCSLPLGSRVNTHKYGAPSRESWPKLEISSMKGKWGVNMTTVTVNWSHETALLYPNSARSPALNPVKWPRPFLVGTCIFLTYNGVEIKLQINSRTDGWERFLLFCQHILFGFPSGQKSHREV